MRSVITPRRALVGLAILFLGSVTARTILADRIVVMLVHNDFDESYRFLKTRYSSSFLKLEKTANGRVAEIAPVEFRPGMADALRRLRTRQA